MHAFVQFSGYMIMQRFLGMQLYLYFRGVLALGKFKGLLNILGISEVNKPYLMFIPPYLICNQKNIC